MPPLVARETVHGPCSRIPIDHLLGVGCDDYARSEVLNCRIPPRFASPQCLLRPLALSDVLNRADHECGMSVDAENHLALTAQYAN